MVVEIRDAGREVCAWNRGEARFKFGILRVEKTANRRISIEESSVEIEQNASDQRLILESA
jgi:hypothetical protein